MHSLFSLLKDTHGVKPSGNFLDAGSGNGVPTLCAAVSVCEFSTAMGVEYSASRVAAANKLKRLYDSQARGDSCEVSFSCSDIRKKGTFDYASVAFANSVMWDAELCAAVAHQMDTMLTGSVVISMSRRFALPSFDLIDVVSLPANGTGDYGATDARDFTFYITQKRATLVGNDYTQATHFVNRPSIALSDSESHALLRNLTYESSPEVKAGSATHLSTHAALIKLAQNSGLHGIMFLAALCASEPSTRLLVKDPTVISFLIEAISRKSTLATRASGSLALRAISAHPCGRRGIAECSGAVSSILYTLCDLQHTAQAADHPAVRANLLDIIGQTLNDSRGLLELEGSVSAEVTELLTAVRKDGEEKSWPSVVHAVSEVERMRQWWKMSVKQ
ncbi:hypothetical protein CYMTET_37939 [Cymbomonas tetramitiformis]|uniref:DOT1 domain-containing protein n=1 Tax=Cymbomonas tetramitiformis TaxID=36881 RepID=A0AAE0CEA9_9CHLO|nr:hypothetical protein CYMTET_37939 [Cymbomonas tetramitiformis]